MGRFELSSDFVINDTLKPHVHEDFRVVHSPGTALRDDPLTGAPVYPRIVTAGSGNAVQEPLIFERLIALTGMERPNVVYIGTPFFDREDKYETGTALFRRAGCKMKRLMVAKECTTPSPEEMRRIVIDWADLIVVSGGNSLFAMLRWRSIGLDALFREAAAGGKVLCGGSAGCGCYYESMQTDSLKPEACKLSERVLAELSPEQRLDWSFVRITCLGFINAFCVPHIDTVGTNGIARVEIAKKMLLEANAEAAAASKPPVFGLGVDEKAAVVYVDGKVSILSAGRRHTGIGEATCHILFVDGLGEVACVPVPPNTGEATTLEELIDRAMRTVVALQSPLDLFVCKDVSAACHKRGYSGAMDIVVNVGDVEGLFSQSQFKQSPEPLLPIPMEEKTAPETPETQPMGDMSVAPSPGVHTRSQSMDSFIIELPLRALAHGTKHMRSKTDAGRLVECPSGADIKSQSPHASSPALSCLLQMAPLQIQTMQ